MKLRLALLALAVPILLGFMVRPLRPVHAASSAHGVDLSWTASTSTYAGLGYNVYRGTSSGGESATPVNSALITGTAYSDADVTANSTYYYTVAACVPSGSATVCSAMSNEVAATVPLAAGDIAAPTGLTGSPH